VVGVLIAEGSRIRLRFCRGPSNDAVDAANVEKRLPPLVSTIAGMGDVIGFLSLGLFTAHVTGNLAVIAALLVRGGPPKMVQILAVPVFIVAVAPVWLIWLGPLSFTEGRPMDVAPHPHIGLQTVTWLLDGEVVHNDSLRSRVFPDLGPDSPKAREG
jgi:Pirin/Protein of unknown function (DUF1275)